MRERAVELWDVIRSSLSGASSTELAVGLGAAILALVLLALATRGLRRRWRVRRDRRRSRSRHEAAREREPPVAIGEEYTVGVQEFSHHHSGDRHAVAKVEGFVVFVTDVPGDVQPSDTIRVSILSFNRGRTSATATFVGRA
ncbi:TRAM domain-containing protein [Halovivax limisalsi]|uniref:TRAM domain-containing protein n=1 Tax=Halovivax limisalsi TaxID=1453760 RepID=UPI001FFC360F|nr:RNA-binding protein [Halovivax limisalsi]